MKPYNDYNTYLQKRYGCRVYRIAIDAGFTCPNRDGTISSGGCAFCGGRGSAASYAGGSADISVQISSRIGYLKSRFGAKKFIAYFQAFSNTYADIGTLKKIYDHILDYDEIVALSIGTRPDTIDEAKLSLIASYAGDRDVWIEYGLQTANDSTLSNINRGHDLRSFTDAVTLTKRHNILTCAHMIIGLPGESAGDFIKTADTLNKLKVDAVKIHSLHILKGSPMEKLYRGGSVVLMSMDDYAKTVADLLERLDPEMIIMRLTGEGAGDEHIAPDWAMNKLAVIEKIEKTLGARKSRQGSLFK